MTEAFTHRLVGSGLLATLQPDPWRPGCWELGIDGTPQSHVDLADPTSLHFSYIARMGHVIDAAFPDVDSITAIHLGAGALTIPRFIEATRPGSRQQVIEIERDLIDFVREHCPLPRGASIRCRYGDAREVLEALPTGLLSAVDLVVVDVFRGARTPAHVTTGEFYETIRRLLSPSGIVLANISDGPPMTFARGQLATQRMVFGASFGLAEQGVARGKRWGNVVTVTAAAGERPVWIDSIAGRGPHPTLLIDDREPDDWARTGTVVTDATAIDSPPPSRDAFRQ